jgi:hypothetical protein
VSHSRRPKRPLDPDDVERLNALVLAATRGTLTREGASQLTDLHKRREADLRYAARYAANLREEVRRQKRHAETAEQKATLELWPERAEDLARKYTDHTARKAQR